MDSNDQSLPQLSTTIAIQTPCKCCGTPARVFGAVDFNRNCESFRKDPLPHAGLPVHYHRCPNCGFLFTIAFDHFSQADFKRYIYNEQYILVDPEYETIRSQRVARQVATAFPEARSVRILDYGAGNGIFARTLREHGFTDVTDYDPFVERFAQKPIGKFDFVISNEVVEHVPNPREVFAELADLITDSGLVLFSTVYQPPNLQPGDADWWYVAPRNGHISIHTAASVASALQPRSIRVGSFDNVMHFLMHRIPPFARNIIRG